MRIFTARLSALSLRLFGEDLTQEGVKGAVAVAVETGVDDPTAEADDEGVELKGMKSKITTST